MTPRQQLEAYASHHQRHAALMHFHVMDMMEIAATSRRMRRKALKEAIACQHKRATRAAAAMVDLFHLIDGEV